jgi:hypothetical protein
MKGISEAARPQGGASRKGNYANIAPLITAYKAGLAGYAPGHFNRISAIGTINQHLRRYKSGYSR